MVLNSRDNSRKMEDFRRQICQIAGNEHESWLNHSIMNSVLGDERTEESIKKSNSKPTKYHHEERKKSSDIVYHQDFWKFNVLFKQVIQNLKQKIYSVFLN